MNEREIGFSKTRGHDHDGENSTPVTLLPQHVKLPNLGTDVLNYIRTIASNTILEYNSLHNVGAMAINELRFVTPTIEPGDTYQTSINWTTLCIVRELSVDMDVSSELTIKFYHNGAFDPGDEEFVIEEVNDGLVYKGLWAHYDGSQSNSIHVEVENTGLNATSAEILLKSSTLSANALVDFVSSLLVDGETMFGEVQIEAGSGVSIDVLDQTITISSVPSESVGISRWTLTPMYPDSFYTSYGSGITNESNLYDPIYDTSYAEFGTGAQNIIADLDGTYTLGKIIVILAHINGSYHDVSVDISTDGIIWEEVKSPSSVAGSGYPIEIYFATGVSASHIRVSMNGSDAGPENRICKILPFISSDRS